MFGDDGEKFGSWPGTKDARLRKRLAAAVLRRAGREPQTGCSVVTPTEALEQVPPLGKVYIPEGSYREMTEWVLPTEPARSSSSSCEHRWEHEGRWQEVAPFVRGGYWRNFKVKYPETNEMYARMQMVSRRLQELTKTGSNGQRRTGRLSDQSTSTRPAPSSTAASAIAAIGTVRLAAPTLPHLRNAVYQHLIAADNLLDAAQGRGLAEGDQPWVELTTDDYNFDGRPEVRLASNRLVALVSPSHGGHLVRAGRPLDLPQPARHAHAPRRGLSSTRSRAGESASQRRRGQHSRPRRVQAGGLDQAAAIRPLPPQEPDRPLLSGRCVAGRGRRRPISKS